MSKKVTIILATLLLIGLFSNNFVSAHQTKPTIVDISFHKNTSIELHIQTNLEALVAGIGPQHNDTDDAPQVQLYKQLRELPADKLKVRFMELESSYRAAIKLSLSGQLNTQIVSWNFSHIEIPAVGDPRISRMSDIYYSTMLVPDMTEVNWQYPERYGDSVVRFITEGHDYKTSHWLTQGKASPVYLLAEEIQPKSRAEIAWQYGVLGYEHILPKGLDHILFVLGLFLLSTKMAPLLWQITAFTLAHSITLGLSIYGLIALSPAIIEPLIALSIVYVGIENIMTKQLKPWRVVIVFLFGLLHGMGFASVLTDLGLPESEFLTALITFNIGVELGQLSVILGAFILVGWLSQRARAYRYAVIIPGSLSIALMGLYWTVERL